MASAGEKVQKQWKIVTRNRQGAPACAATAGALEQVTMNPARLVDLLSEIVMLVLGLLLLLLALSGRYAAPTSARMWLLLGAALATWGGRTLLPRGRRAGSDGQLMRWVRGGSLVLAGALMITMAWAPQSRTQTLLAVVGGIVAARGLAGAALAVIRGASR